MSLKLEKLKRSLPEYLTVKQYCELIGCCTATAYKKMWITPGLAVKFGKHTFINRDIVLAEMERDEQPLPWVQQREHTVTPEFTALEPPKAEGVTTPDVHSIDL
jgi:hypothetical protein